MKSVRFWLIFGAGVAVRLALMDAATFQTASTPDSEGYWELAGSLRAGDGFSRASGEGGGHGRQPEIFRTPGYPALLAIARSIEDTDEPAGLAQAWRVAVVFGVLLDSAALVLTYLLGLLLLNHRAALIAMAFQAFSPLAIASSCRLLSDTPYMVLFLASVLLMVGHLKTGTVWSAAVAAAVLAAACYFRPVAIVMAVLFAAAALLRGRFVRRAGNAGKNGDASGLPPVSSPGANWSGRGRFGSVVAAGTVVGVFLLCVAPWVVRNVVRADYWGFSSFASDAAYYFAAAEVVARQEGLSGEQARDEMVQRERVWLASQRGGVTPGQAARWRGGEAMRVFAADPWLYLRLHLGGTFGVLLPGATDVLEVAGTTAGGRDTLETFRTRGLAAAVRAYFGGNVRAMVLGLAMAAVPVVKYLAVIAAGIAGLRKRWPIEVWLLILISAATILLPGPFGLPRYRLPIEPLLAVAAAAGILAVAGRLRRTK